MSLHAKRESRKESHISWSELGMNKIHCLLFAEILVKCMIFPWNFSILTKCIGVNREGKIKMEPGWFKVVLCLQCPRIAIWRDTLQECVFAFSSFILCPISLCVCRCQEGLAILQNSTSVEISMPRRRLACSLTLKVSTSQMHTCLLLMLASNRLFKLVVSSTQICDLWLHVWLPVTNPAYFDLLLISACTNPGLHLDYTSAFSFCS